MQVVDRLPGLAGQHLAGGAQALAGLGDAGDDAALILGVGDQKPDDVGLGGPGVAPVEGLVTADDGQQRFP